MKKNLVLLVVSVLVSLTFVQAQIKSFDEEIAPLHKKAVITCGMLKNMDSFDQQKFIKNLDELKTEFQNLSGRFY